MKTSICSYSFHRLLASGQQDIFRYITDCKSLGCTQLDPWMAHLAPIQAGCEAVRKLPSLPDSLLTSDEIRYLTSVRRAADSAGLPFGCLAVDGAHMYDTNPGVRAGNRAVAYRWIDAAAILGCSQIRLDTGGTFEMPDEQFEVILSGYRDAIARAGERGIKVLMENHWGASQVADNCVRILKVLPELGLLWDSFNFHPHNDAVVRNRSREVLAPFASLTHLKTFTFTPDGNEPNEDIPHAIRCLSNAGYNGTIGFESCPSEGVDERQAVRQAISLATRLLSARQ